MVKITLNKKDILNLLSWTGMAKLDRVGVQFEEDVEETLRKIKQQVPWLEEL